MVSNAIREFLITCPFLKSNANLGIDYLGEQTVSYSIMIDTSDSWYKKYSDGGGLKLCNFRLVASEYSSSSDLDNSNNLSFFEKFSEWIEQQNLSRNLPILKDSNGNVSTKYKAQIVECLSNGYLFDDEGGNAYYQIALRLIYTSEV